jgi:hypothetical protein
MDKDEAMAAAQVTSSHVLLYLAEMGIDQQVFHASVEIPSADIKLFPHRDLMDWRLLTHSDSPNDLRSDEDLDNMDIRGGDEASFPIQTYEDCKSECRKRATCKAITFNKRFHWCFVKSTVGQKKSDSDALSWIK